MAKEVLTMVVVQKGDSLLVNSLVRAMAKLKDLITELAQNAVQDVPELRCVVTSLTLSSPASVGIGVENVPEEFDVQKLQRITIDGFNRLKDSPIEPPAWTKKAMRHGRLLSKIVDNKAVSGITLQNGKSRTDLDSELATSLAALATSAFRSTSIGAIDGRLELVDIHRGFRVGIYRALDDKYIAADFDVPSENALDLVRDLLGKRVYAIGSIAWDKTGEPKKIVVREIGPFARSEKEKSILDLYGSDPDFTEGMSVEEFIRRRRGD